MRKMLLWRVIVRFVVVCYAHKWMFVNRLLQVTTVPYVESGNNLDFYPPTHMYIHTYKRINHTTVNIYCII